jgi:PLP dependent protein
MGNATELIQRLESIRERIARAAERAGRSPEAVLLLPVTKGFPAETVRQAMSLGLREFGENRVQEAEAKIAAIEPRPRWRLIGHLQSNKAKRAVQIFDAIDSIDSESLAAEVSRRAVEGRRRMPCLVEVNTSGDRTKFGTPPEGAEALLSSVRSLPGIDLRGLMTIGPLEGGLTGARSAFRELSSIRDRAVTAGLLPADATLSMGMSGDFEAAIEEGSTMVRVGTALFGPRPPA